MLIQKLRVQRGWSQEQLAEISGLSVRTIQRLENGAPGSMESLKALGAVFETDFNTLKEPAMSTTIPAEITTPAPASIPAVSNEEALAMLQVKRIKAFYHHAFQYLVVVLVLALINITLTPERKWVLFVALGWGIGLLLHGLKAFDRIPYLNGDWERREVEKRLGRKLG